MNSIMKKLTSQSGASITYALLLFLVCSMVSAVVLTAGTAAAGRISGSVSSDQRYYSVTSAAQFLKETLDGQSDTIVYPAKEDGTDVIVDTENIASTTFNKSAIPTSLSISEYASAVVGGLINALTGESNKLTFNVDDYNESGTVSTTSSLSDADKEDLKVDIVPTITTIRDDTGAVTEATLTLDVSNANNSEEGTYTLRLTFTGGIEDRVNKKKYRDASGNEKTSYTITRKITWDYYGMETVTATTTTTPSSEGGDGS